MARSSSSSGSGVRTLRLDGSAAAAANGPAQLEERVRRLESRLARERNARLEAERLLETKSLALFESNRALIDLAGGLERRVEERTRELSAERQRALEIAETDALTGIANRGAFNRWLAQALAQAAAGGPAVTVLLVDLDQFKSVNDRLGHAAGDAMLQAVAWRIRGAVRSADRVARLGGDEFAVILRSDAGAPSALDAAKRVLGEVCRPVAYQSREVPCSCSIGMATGADADALLCDVDTALYASKRVGRGQIRIFDANLRAELESRTALHTRVRQAVEDDAIEPWYQPIVDRASGACLGVEVLARWRLADGGVHSPNVFLKPVEDMGLLDTMTETLLRNAFAEAAPAVRAGRLGYVSVNVSPTQFNEGWVQRRIVELLRGSGLPPTALVVEITETALLKDPAHTRSMLTGLGKTGIRIALDDFGVGYSNFSLMLKLPIDILKLDQSLTRDIVADPQARALCECLLDLAARLRLKVVAEGVETEAQADVLGAAGCAVMQGYWFARPRRSLDALLGPGTILRA